MRWRVWYRGGRCSRVAAKRRALTRQRTFEVGPPQPRWLVTCAMFSTMPASYCATRRVALHVAILKRCSFCRTASTWPSFSPDRLSASDCALLAYLIQQEQRTLSPHHPQFVVRKARLTSRTTVQPPTSAHIITITKNVVGLDVIVFLATDPSSLLGHCETLQFPFLARYLSWSHLGRIVPPPLTSASCQSGHEPSHFIL